MNQVEKYFKVLCCMECQICQPIYLTLMDQFCNVFKLMDVSSANA